MTPPHPWLDPHGLPDDMALGCRWGLLRIVGYAPIAQGTLVTVVCLCGRIVDAAPALLRYNPALAYPCRAPQPLPLGEAMALGRRWGGLSIIGYEQRRERYCRRTCVICLCLCGALHTTRPTNLRAAGNTLSCGCYRRTANRARCHQRWQEVRAGRRVLTVGRPRTLHRKAA